MGRKKVVCLKNLTIYFKIIVRNINSHGRESELTRAQFIYEFIMRGLPDFLLKVLLSPEERVSARERERVRSFIF